MNTKIIIGFIFFILLIILMNKYETFQMMYSINTNNKVARMYNITHSANIPGIDDTSTYQGNNKCISWNAYKSCNNKTRMRTDDLGCDEVIDNTQAGYCNCTIKNTVLGCNSNKANMTCNQACKQANPPKSLEFNGKYSFIRFNYKYNKSSGFTISFYMKMSPFMTLPYKNQTLLQGLDKNMKKVFLLYLNKDKKIGFKSYKTNIDVTYDLKLNNNWQFISFGNLNTRQFIEVNGHKRKTIIGKNIDEKNINYINLIIGGHRYDYRNNELNYYKGLLGNINVHKKYLTSEELCKNNRYCKDYNDENDLNSNKCSFLPEGSNSFECIKKCKRNTMNNNCNIDDCIYKCETCEDKDKCKWKQKMSDFMEIDRPEQPTIENPEQCKFKPWGLNKKHCISECSEGENKNNYGGELCTKDTCNEICNKCDNPDTCNWKKMPDDVNNKVPDPPQNLVGVLGDREVKLYWEFIPQNNITDYKIFYYENNNQENSLRVVTYNVNELVQNINRQDNSVRVTLDNLRNNVTYVIGVVAINSEGASTISRLIQKTPDEKYRSKNSRTSANNNFPDLFSRYFQYEYFQNPDNSVTTIDDNLEYQNTNSKKCNLLESLMGKTVEIEL